MPVPFAVDTVKRFETIIKHMAPEALITTQEVFLRLANVCALQHQLNRHAERLSANALAVIESEKNIELAAAKQAANE